MKPRTSLRLLLSSLALLVLAAAGHNSAHAQMYWNCAAVFGGTDSSYVVTPSSSALSLSSFTLECWIKPDPSANIRELIAKGKNHATYTTGYELMLNNDGRLRVRTNGATKLYSTQIVPPNVWTHVAATYDSASRHICLYLNGLLDHDSTFASLTPIAQSSDSLYLGVGLNNPYAGAMDEARIWRRARSESEIRETMTISLGASGGVYDDLVLSYTFQRPYSSSSPVISFSDMSGSGVTGIARNISVLDLGHRPQTTICDWQSVKLSGNAGSCLVAPSTTAIDISGSFTVECWVWPNAVTGESTLIQKREGSHSTGYTLYLYGMRPSIRTNGLTNLMAAHQIPAGQWSHLAATFNSVSDSFAIYINGILDTARVVAAPPTAGTDSLYIGTGYNGVFSGYIDEIRISKYAKSPDVIAKFVHCSIDNFDEPMSGNTNVVYNLDGLTADNANDGGPRLLFRGDAKFSSPGFNNNVPQAPLLRADNLNFPAGFYLSNEQCRIPASGDMGEAKAESLYVQESMTVSDLNLSLLLNHTAESDLVVTLESPSGDSVVVTTDAPNGGGVDNIVTIFDDQADSSINHSSTYFGLSPCIRPVNSLNAALSGTNSHGWWVLHIGDKVAGDTGRVYSWGLQFNNQIVLGVGQAEQTHPMRCELMQNWPNPFNPSTSISYSIAGGKAQGVGEWVRLSVFDLLGREVAVLVDGYQTPGLHKVTFDARRLASGVYFYRLTAGTTSLVKRMIVLK